MPVIIGTQGLGYDVGDHPRGEYAFEYQGNLYAFLRQSTLLGDRKIYAFRSTDDGATWTDLGAADYVSENTVRYTIAHDGNMVYMLVLEANYEPGPPYDTFPPGYVPTVLKLFTFDLGAATWSGATNFSSGPNEFVEFEYGGNLVYHQCVTIAFMRLLVRGPGDCVFFYSGAPSVADGRQYSKLYARPFNGSTFGTAQALPEQVAGTMYTGQGGCVDSSGVCHLLYTSGDVFHVGFSALDTFGAVWQSPGVYGEIAFSYLGGNYGDISEPLAYRNGGVEQIGFGLWVGKGGGASQWIGFFHAAVALAPSFVYQEIVQQDDLSHTSGGSAFMDEGVTSPTLQGFQLVNTLFCLVKAVSSTGTDHLCIAWANTQSTDDDGWTGSQGYAQRLISPANTLAWEFDTPITAGAFAENTFLPANTVIGISGAGRYAVILLSEESYDFKEEALADVTTFEVILPPPPTITCGDPPAGRTGVAYAHTLPVTYETDTFTVALTGGALPDGLSMDATGAITGTPTRKGSFPFTATITDAEDQTAEISCSILITGSFTLVVVDTAPPPPSGTFRNFAY